MQDKIDDNIDINWDNIMSHSEYEKLPDEIKKANEREMKEACKRVQLDTIEMLTILDEIDENEYIDYDFLARRYSEDFCQFVKEIKEKKTVI